MLHAKRQRKEVVMARRKKRARTRQVEGTPTIDMPPDEPERYDIPAPFPLLEIEGPSAKELAAHGSTFLTQALLVKNIGDAPALANRDDVMPAEVFGMRELMMGLALVGILFGRGCSVAVPEDERNGVKTSNTTRNTRLQLGWPLSAFSRSVRGDAYRRRVRRRPATQTHRIAE